MNTTTRSMAAALAVAFFLPVIAPAMTITEFRKFPVQDQGTYIGAAIGMLTFVYATTGEVEKARCIQSWYYGKPGTPTPGPGEIRVELAAAANLDPDKYHVEGVILGVTDRACSAEAQSKAKP